MSNAAEMHFSQGSALAAAGRHREALDAYERALALRPDYVEVLNNRGLTLAALRRHDDALASYDAALKLRPNYPRALNNRGLALARLGRHEEALVGFGRARALQPGYFAAEINAADSLIALGRPGEAIALLEESLAAGRPDTQVRCRIAVSLQAAGEHGRALALLEGVLAVEPGNRVALNAQALALQELKQFEAATESWRQLLAILPPEQTDAIAELLNNLGGCLRSLARFEDARQCFARALALRPDYPEAFYNRAQLEDELGERNAALEDCARALALRPDYLLALDLQSGIQLGLDRYEEALAALERALRLASAQPRPAVAPGLLQAAELFARAASCDWEGYDAKLAALTAVVDRDEPTNPFLYLCFSQDAARQRRCAEYAIRERERTARPPLWRGERYPHRRIRIAYVCGEFKDHPVAQLMAGLLERHDRERFEVTGVSIGSPGERGALRQRIERGVDRFLDAHAASAADIAHQLRELETDIVVDLNGFTGSSRFEIFEHRPAPLQVAYLAYPGTTGSPYIDYLLADAVVIPQEARRHYTEQVVHLPVSFFPSDDRRSPPGPTPARAALGLPEDVLVFCVFNHSYKITPAVFAVWMRLLEAIEGSVLWLRQREESVQRNLRAAAARAGIAPARLVFAGFAPAGEHIARQRQADLFLDTLPYNAHSTAADALAADLPIVTCAGDTFASRVCASLLTAAGIPELITRSLPEYEGLACSLARDRRALEDLRARLAVSRVNGPLFDTARICRAIEAAFGHMWRQHQAGRLPAGFAID